MYVVKKKSYWIRVDPIPVTGELNRKKTWKTQQTYREGNTMETEVTQREDDHVKAEG